MSVRISRAAVTNNANSKMLRIERLVEDRGTPTPERMNAIAAIVDEWRSGVGPVHAPPAPRPDLVEMLSEAEGLLGDSRPSSHHDAYALHRWSRRVADLRNRILDVIAGS